MFGANLALCFRLPAANARTAAMLPVVSSVANQLADDDSRSTGARKAIVIQWLVYGSMIAGVTTMAARLPNFILVKLLADHGLRIGFFRWFAFNAPCLGMFGLTQLWVKRLFRASGVRIAGGAERIASLHAALGRISGAKMALLAIIGCVALLFLLGKGSTTLEPHSLPIGMLAPIGMMLLFIPGVSPFNWRAIQADTAWGAFLLIGGAQTLTSAVASSGSAVWLDGHIKALVTHRNWWAATVVVIIGTHVIRLSMLSTLAAVALLAPITYALGALLHLNAPVFAALIYNGDSFSYVLPTQITAGVIAYGSGAFTVTGYARLGLVSTAISIVYIMLVIVPWYALLGLPLWHPAAPWPF